MGRVNIREKNGTWGGKVGRKKRYMGKGWENPVTGGKITVWR